MMRMNREAALDRLLELVYEHRDESGAMIIDRWRRALLEHEDRELGYQEARREQAIKSMRYGLQHIELVPYTDIDGSESYEAVVDKQVAVTHDKVADMAKEQGIPVKEAWKLIRGEIREYKGWRGVNMRGLSNGYYIPTHQERLEQLAEMRREDEVIQKRAANYKPRPNVHKQPEMKVYE